MQPDIKESVHLEMRERIDDTSRIIILPNTLNSATASA